MALPLVDGLVAVFSEAVARARGSGQPVVASWTFQIPSPAHPLRLFAQGNSDHACRVYWEQAAAGIAFAGLGAALAIQTDGPGRFRQASALAEEILATAVVDGDAVGTAPGGPFLFGGFAFDPNRPAMPHWRNFPAGLLILPRMLIAERAGEAAVTISAWLRPGDDPDEAVAVALRDLALVDAPDLPADTAGSAAHVEAQSEVPPPAVWKGAVATAAADVRSGRFEKIVLARELRLRVSEPFCPVDVLSRLRAANPRAMVFAFSIGDQCFLGATPELLVRLENRTVTAHCLAGSIGIGATEDETQALARRLLSSAKDRVEHEVVVRSTEAALSAVCHDVSRASGTPWVVRSGSVQHLATPLTGRLRNGRGVLELVDVLHPTPAVGGFPREVAMAAIREREEFDRGWYAGPVGWMSRSGDGEFAVAIRSALLTGPEASLFAGCGIVADSDPDAEYQETCLKLKPMLAALNVQ